MYMCYISPYVYIYIYIYRERERSIDRFIIIKQASRPHVLQHSGTSASPLKPPRYHPQI